MAAIPGSVPITGFIAPTDTGDTFATQDETYNRGGFRTVADLTARDAITADRRLEGMLVRVLSTGYFYTLSGGILNSNWIVETFGGTAGALVYQGDLDLPADFPTPAAVQVDDLYGVKTDVTDNDATKTNTGQSFVAGELIRWNGANWDRLNTAFAAKDQPYDNSTSGLSATNTQDAIDEVAAGSTGNYKSDVVPTGLQDGLNNLFTIPGGKSYRPNSLTVYLNGGAYQPASIQENGPGYTTFNIVGGDTLPVSASGDSFWISYIEV
jgi:hypothetical protein